MVPSYESISHSLFRVVQATHNPSFCSFPLILMWIGKQEDPECQSSFLSPMLGVITSTKIIEKVSDILMHK